MSRCDRMVDVGRRKFMSGAGLAAAGVAVTSIAPTPAKVRALQRRGSTIPPIVSPTLPTSRSTSR